jgi:hypothetical protein
MKRRPVRFVDVVLCAGPDICFLAVGLHILGARLELPWLQFIGVCVLTWPVGYVISFYLMRWLFGDD